MPYFSRLGLNRWMNTAQTYLDLKRKIACYLSAEFLIGPYLRINLLNKGEQ